MPDMPLIEACKNTGPDAAAWPDPLPGHDLDRAQEDE